MKAAIRDVTATATPMAQPMTVSGDLPFHRISVRRILMQDSLWLGLGSVLGLGSGIGLELGLGIGLGLKFGELKFGELD